MKIIVGIYCALDGNELIPFETTNRTHDDRSVEGIRKKKQIPARRDCRKRAYNDKIWKQKDRTERKTKESRQADFLLLLLLYFYVSAAFL